MSANQNDPYPTGTYVKGDQTRQADTAADAVQAAFDGFKRVPEDSDVATATASVNSNDPQDVRTDESGEDGSDASDEDGDYEFEENAEFSDDQAEPLSDDHFEGRNGETYSTEDPAGPPIDKSDPSRSYS